VCVIRLSILSRRQPLQIRQVTGNHTGRFRGDADRGASKKKSQFATDRQCKYITFIISGKHTGDTACAMTWFAFNVLRLQYDDVAFFKFRTINRTTISLRLARSLDDLVDRQSPIELLKVKLVCGVDEVSVTIRSY